MNKELQDKAWAVLPKEFREEVKKEWKSVDNVERFIHDAFLRGEYSMLTSLFGKHNLISGIEPRQVSEKAQNENNGSHNIGNENKQPAVRIYRPNINLTSPSDNQLCIMVAAEAMKGMLANTNIIMSCGDLEDNQEYITKHAVEYADALIKEINGKGGSDERK